MRRCYSNRGPTENCNVKKGLISTKNQMDTGIGVGRSPRSMIRESIRGPAAGCGGRSDRGFCL